MIPEAGCRLAVFTRTRGRSDVDTRGRGAATLVSATERLSVGGDLQLYYCTSTMALRDSPPAPFRQHRGRIARRRPWSPC